MALPLNSRWSAASRALEPERLPTIDNTPQLATAHHVDIDKRIDDLFLELAYIVSDHTVKILSQLRIV